ncbi:hypothetical protein ACFLRI_04275 [Bacteroidota bacterium]
MEHGHFHHPHPKNGKNKYKSLAFAFTVLTTGVLLLLNNIGLLPDSASEIIFSWQMLIIAIGFINLFGRSFLWGLFLIIIGGFFLGADFWGITYEIQNLFWPVVLIISGFSILLFSFGYFKKKSFNFSSSDENFIEDISVFGGGERSFTSQTFKGGKLVGVFGGSKINMSNTFMEDGVHTLEVVMVFGGTQLIVPRDWNVKTEVFNMFGGFADKRSLSEINTNKTLVIKGVVIFGGGELRN